MKVIHVNATNLHDLQSKAPEVAMALGYFDGVHLGHQKVVEAAKQQALKNHLSLAVLSFFPHPKSVLIPNFDVSYLEPIEQKIEKLESLGVDLFYVVEFTKELAKVGADEFIQQYVTGLHAKEIICGFDYTYGAKASGNAETLKQYALQQTGVTIVEELKWQGQKISSTLIRKLLNECKLQEIRSLLGDYYITKYCCKNGLFPNYSLPKMGKYKILIEKDGSILEAIATVKSNKKILLKYDSSIIDSVLTIKWIERL
ncbi:riboflavin kinase/FMN adenylyltransferase [Psychrobacillus insolitus]|uniref:FAD synthase n=1 Tax=Psychrobacillus insolitus TaxID=1461 RepID=A0A2W7P6X4_9BACI|nr:FAD synthetase family protein [Psychrobacillus insolitus]PZX01289.1 riboflavin kinase/FMN adenylyltransferase [Psychrobacillus insolitus]